MTFKDYIIELVGFGACAGFSYTCYYFLRTGQELVTNLKNAHELEISSDLIPFVANQGGNVLAFVRGIVKAVETPVKSLSRPDILGVVWRITIKEYLDTQIKGYWLSDARILDSSTGSVPFILIGNDMIVQIADPTNLDVELMKVSEKFEVANNSLADHFVGWMRGVRSTGTQHTEEMLVEGTRVLGVGRLVLKEKELVLESTKLLPYAITIKDRKTFIEEYQSPFVVLRVLAVISALGATYFGYKIISRWYSKWKKEVDRRAELFLLEDARNRREAQNSDLPESLMCVVCCGLRDVVLIPCQHVCICGECALKLSPRHCPVCRTTIERIQPVFYS